jgi:ABC-type transport system involved in multi-copper enzyme maturation permease subunit
MRLGVGPVFASERLTASRRWQYYALRAFGVATVLVAMGMVAYSEGAFFGGRRSVSAYTRLGRSYFNAMIEVELFLVMLAAPATTAGAICVDRSRGTLEHLMTTDLSDTEIVLGKLAARLMPVLGMVACSLPVLALSTLLGGIDALSLAVAFAVIVAVALLAGSDVLDLGAEAA